MWSCLCTTTREFQIQLKYNNRNMYIIGISAMKLHLNTIICKRSFVVSLFQYFFCISRGPGLGRTYTGHCACRPPAPHHRSASLCQTFSSPLSREARSPWSPTSVTKKTPSNSSRRTLSSGKAIRYHQVELYYWNLRISAWGYLISILIII